MEQPKILSRKDCYTIGTNNMIKKFLQNLYKQGRGEFAQHAVFAHQNQRAGFALFVAIGVASILLLVTVAMSNVTLKQVLIAQSSQESQKAFYAADNGIE